MYYILRNDELYHHGILGQKWGVRRYQNADGSLTPEGIKRYHADSKTGIYGSNEDLYKYGKDRRNSVPLTQRHYITKLGTLSDAGEQALKKENDHGGIRHPILAEAYRDERNKYGLACMVRQSNGRYLVKHATTTDEFKQKYGNLAYKEAYNAKKKIRGNSDLFTIRDLMYTDFLESHPGYIGTDGDVKNELGSKWPKNEHELKTKGLLKKYKGD